MEKAAVRGTVIHEAVQIWCETKDKTLALAYAKDYTDWVEHLINYRMWNTWECVANELRMVDRKRDIAGSCDVILQHKDTGVLCLADFKTQEVYKKKNHRLQMGGYVSLLNQNYPQIQLWSCRVIYITPNGIKTQDYNPLECMYDYEEARGLYFGKQLPF
jgi:ATP-dependent exoDNAse (exonuclease V) beta subunit